MLVLNVTTYGFTIASAHILGPTGYGALAAWMNLLLVVNKNVPEGRSFDLFTAPDMEPLGTFSSEDLAAGLDISLPEKRTAQVVLILPHQE